MFQVTWKVVVFVLLSGVNDFLQKRQVNAQQFGGNVGFGGGNNGFGGGNSGFGGGNDGSGQGSLSLNIPGTPGIDYPVLDTVPNTGFTCFNQPPGYYADTAQEARCQVFHICEHDGRMHSFLCPVGTVFNQQYFVCDWWYNFGCSSAEQFYKLNSLIGQVNGGNSGNGGNFGGNNANTGNFGAIGGFIM